MIEDRTLIDAIAAPGAGNAEHLHLAPEPSQQRLLLVRESDLRMHTPPALPVLLCAVILEKSIIFQTLVKCRCEVHSSLPWLGGAGRSRIIVACARILSIASTN